MTVDPEGQSCGRLGGAINTDAHGIQGLDLMKYGVMTARRGWLEKGDVVNALGLRDLMEIFRS